MVIFNFDIAVITVLRKIDVIFGFLSLSLLTNRFSTVSSRTDVFNDNAFDVQGTVRWLRPKSSDEMGKHVIINRRKTSKLSKSTILDLYDIGFVQSDDGCTC